MDNSPRSIAAGLARAQLASALTIADGMQRYVGLTLRCGENFAGALDTIVRESGELKGYGWDRAAAHALAGYRDYVRELAALPGIASMHYYDQLNQLRTAARVKGAHMARTPPPTESMLLLAPAAASSEAAPAGRSPPQPPAQSKERPGKKPR